MGEKDHGFGDLFGLSVEDYATGECGASCQPSSPGVAETVPPTPSALGLLSTSPGSSLFLCVYLTGRVYEPSLSSILITLLSLFLGCEQEIRHSQDPEVMVVLGKDA